MIPKITAAVMEDWQIFMPNIEQHQGLQQISLAYFVDSIEKAAESTNKPNLGWLIGSSCTYLSRGILGRVVMGSKTIGIGLHWLCRYYPLIQEATHVKLDIIDGVARLSYNILDPDIWPRTRFFIYFEYIC